MSQLNNSCTVCLLPKFGLCSWNKHRIEGKNYYVFILSPMCCTELGLWTVISPKSGKSTYRQSTQYCTNPKLTCFLFLNTMLIPWTSSSVDPRPLWCREARRVGVQTGNSLWLQQSPKFGNRLILSLGSLHKSLGMRLVLIIHISWLTHVRTRPHPGLGALVQDSKSRKSLVSA